MKVAVVGSRDIKTLNLDAHIPPQTDTIISGGAVGVDTLSEEYAKKNNLKKIIIRPDYKKYQRSAPIIRNKKIVDLADLVIAFWNGKSRGTKFTIDYAQLQGKKVIVHKIVDL